VRIPDVVDLAFSHWLASKWTAGLTRIVILLLPFALGAFWWAWASVQTSAVSEVRAVKASLVEVNGTLDVRATDSESFQAEVRKAVTDLNTKVDDLGDDMFTTRVDIGVIKRLVTELRNQQIADAAPLLNRPASRPAAQQ
jgi:hypothetical protein